MGLGSILLWLVRGGEGVFVNDGFLVLGLGLLAFGTYCIACSLPLQIDETAALVAASRAVGFPVGHASAQMGWRGLLSRPTWRILLYSTEDPPARRGLVLIDGLDASVVQHFVEENPEDWNDPSA